MRIVLDTRKTVEQNAALYFERAKKAKRKLEGAQKALMLAQEKIKAQVEEKPKEKVQKVQRKLEWYEKLRWFVSSNGFLCIGGRDASTNEMIIKRHAQRGDIVFHTDMAGSPFVVIKAEGKEIPMTTLEEAAQFTACFSRAWKNGFGYLEVFYVAPEQLTKEPNPGEFLPKGAFMVRGSVKYLKPKIEICLGKDAQGRAIVGAPSAVLAHSAKGILVMQGNEKTSDVAKRLAKMLDLDVDEVVPLLPSGGVKLGKEVRTL
jgi:predicted ribosome quality control (RQC) complex YloA/Tae2 family protein